MNSQYKENLIVVTYSNKRLQRKDNYLYYVNKIKWCTYILHYDATYIFYIVFDFMNNCGYTVTTNKYIWGTNFVEILIARILCYPRQLVYHEQ
jgi:hypothetical protein